MKIKKHQPTCRNCIYKKSGIFGYYCTVFDKWYIPLKSLDIQWCDVKYDGSSRTTKGNIVWENGKVKII